MGLQQAPVECYYCDNSCSKFITVDPAKLVELKAPLTYIDTLFMLWLRPPFRIKVNNILF